MDSSFDGQRVAAIQTMEAGFTLVRVRFAHMPVALKIKPGEVEQLYARDLQLENIRDAAFVAGNWRNSHSAVTLTNIACSNVPRFCGGEQPVAEPSADNTAALQAAIDQHPVLFFPSGTYRVSGPLVLKPGTVLIGLNPGNTQIALMAGSEAFAGEGDSIGVITAPRGGSNIISSISVGTGVRNPRAAGVVWMAGLNSMLDDVSFPVGFLGGLGGTAIELNQGAKPALNRNRNRNRNLNRLRDLEIKSKMTIKSGRSLNSTALGLGGGRGRGAPGASGAGAPAAVPAPAGGGFGRGPAFSNTQAGDLIVRDGGGGIFRGCWPHDTNAKAGLRVENTTTPGKIYQMSVEHHYRIECQFFNVRNWEMYALQTEEENPAGAEANAVEIQNSQNLLFANTYLYRVSRNILPKAHGILVRRSDRIAFQNMKVFSQTRLAFDNAVLEVPERPGSLAFGGLDQRTLFIGARSSLYSIRIQGALPQKWPKGQGF